MRFLQGAVLLAVMASGVLCGPCPDFDSFDVMYGDEFLCAHYWEGRGHPDPSLACNPWCTSSGESYGHSWEDGTYYDVEDGFCHVMGSLYVWPGCTLHGYKGYTYTDETNTYVGPYMNYDLVGPLECSDSNCPNCFHSYKCLCTQKPIECYPSDSYGNVLLCDNSGGITDVTCQYMQQIGTSYSASASESMSVSESVEESIKVGLGKIFSTGIGTSTTTGYDWSTSTTETYNQVVSQTITATAPAGYVLHIDQVIGVCDDNITRPPVFKTYHTTDGKSVVEGSVRHFTLDPVEGAVPIKEAKRRNEGKMLPGAVKVADLPKVVRHNEKYDV